jgi:adenylate cyclase class 2
MHEEIEAKLKVDSLEAVERRLGACGATFLGETVQTDAYFDTVACDFTRGDKALRLRREKTGQCERLILTYKGPKQPDDYKKRVEVELEVSDGAAAEALLVTLGYDKALAFDKRRRLWRLQDCEVALDELPLLGTFVEIEGPDSHTILQVQKMLDLSLVPHTMDSYASLIERELRRLGGDRREVHLENRE